MTLQPDFDVAIAGAGPAGAAAALFAARAGYRVAVFDKARFPRDKPCGEGLMPSGRTILRELELEAEVCQAGAPPLEGVAFRLVEGATHEEAFPQHPRGRTGLGVRRIRFDAMLAERLESHSQIAFIPETTVHQVSPADGELPRLLTSRGEVVARSVAIADGLRSSLRHRLGWTRGPKRPHRYGIVGHWRSDEPPDPWIRITVGNAFELYEAPVGPKERLLGLLCHRGQMRRFAGQLGSTYNDIALSLRPELKAASPVDEAVATGPFRYSASTVAQNGIFLVGDAAGFVDPISGEGLATGLLQGRAFALALAQPDPERAYREAHRQLTRDPRRATSLLVLLSGKPTRAARGMRGLSHAPALMPKLLGVILGYWGFNRLTPREWLALFAGV